MNLINLQKITKFRKTKYINDIKIGDRVLVRKSGYFKVLSIKYQDQKYIFKIKKGNEEKTEKFSERDYNSTNMVFYK